MIMVDEDDKMHGSIFVLLQKFIVSTYSHSFWVQRKKDAGIPSTRYTVGDRYPTNEIFKLLQAISMATGASHHELQEKFGEHLVPDLLSIYGKYIDPNWKTYNLIRHTESIMHKAVRMENQDANPPILNISPVSNKLIIIDYYSKRRMASLAIGIIKGIAKYYNEKKDISVKTATGMDDERVQIRIEFQQ
jgi:hypothetical protein